MSVTHFITCDHCGKQVNPGTEPLDGWIDVSIAGEDYERADLCSWDCVANYATLKQAGLQ